MWIIALPLTAVREVNEESENKSLHFECVNKVAQLLQLFHVYDAFYENLFIFIDISCLFHSFNIVI